MTKGKQPYMPAIGSLGGHIMAFTAADFFGNLQAFPPFNSTAPLSLLVMPLAMIFGLGLRMGASKIREGYSARQGEAAHTVHEWQHQCEHTEDEFIAFTCGLLLSQTCRFALTGYLPPIYGYKKKKKFSTEAIWGLLALGFGFGFICILIGFIKKKLNTDNSVVKLICTTL